MTPALATSNSATASVPGACSATTACLHARAVRIASWCGTGGEQAGHPAPQGRPDVTGPSDGGAPDGETWAALERLAGLPGVPAAIDEARQACTELRWHPALRRRADQVRAEAGMRAVRASAALAGARFPVALVRDVARGAATFPQDAARRHAPGRTALGALRAHAEAQALSPGWERAPLQALARLHMVAAAGLVPDAALGRPRGPAEAPGDGADLLTAAGRPLAVVDAAQVPARLAGV